MKLKEHVEQHIYDNQDGFRYHLGASIIGQECERQIWYSWRWFKDVKHSARMVRLFERGHNEEEIIIRFLREAGCKIQQLDEESGKQLRLVSIGGHFGGSLDGVLLNPADDSVVGMGNGLLEFKTSGYKYFLDLVKNGVKKAKPEHYVQMQIYMKAYDLKWALYICVNKNNDEWHWEIVFVDDHTADRYLNRAANIIGAHKPPPRINENPSYYKCNWCDYRKICHGQEQPAMNCRTCVSGHPMSDGRWQCEKIPTYKIRTAEEAETKNKPLVHTPCKGLEYECITTDRS